MKQSQCNCLFIRCSLFRHPEFIFDILFRHTYVFIGLVCLFDRTKERK